MQGAGLNWLFPFVDGHPPIGWETAGAYLIMPVLLVRGWSRAGLRACPCGHVMHAQPGGRVIHGKGK